MTKAITTSNVRKARNAKASTPVRVATIALKTMHDDIMKSNANATITTKKMRVYLRKNYAHIHDHNNSWMFTNDEYNEVRSYFDAKFAKSLNATPRKSRKIDVVVDVADMNKVDA